MNSDRSLRWAITSGYILVAALIVHAFVMRGNPMHVSSLKVIILSAANLFFIVALTFHLQGYVTLAVRYSLPILKWVTRLFICTMAVMFFIATLSMILFVLDRDTNPGIVLFTLATVFHAYAFGPFIIGLLTLSLKRELGPQVFAPLIVGSVWVIYYFGEILNILPLLAGTFILVPIPEALFALAGTILFRHALQKGQ